MEKIRSLFNAVSTLLFNLNKSRLMETYSTPHSCKHLPFFNPLNLNLLGSGIAFVEASTGPMGHAASKPLE
jgi:hypothetical protein